MNEVENSLSLFVMYKRDSENALNGRDEHGISSRFGEMQRLLEEAEYQLNELPWSLDVENVRCIIERFYKQLHTLRQRYTGGWDWTR
jgi:hypothetical protein